MEMVNMENFKLSYKNQYYWLIVNMCKEQGIKLNTSNVMKYLKDNNKSENVTNFRSTISGHLSDLKEMGILSCNERLGRLNLYELNQNKDIDAYLRKVATEILTALDIDIQNVYQECEPNFTYLDLDKCILTHSQISELVNTYGRKIIYGI